MEDDATLVREAVDGSLHAFSDICSRHETRVHDLAVALLRDRKAAWEVVNDTFVEASERLESLQEPDRLVVWLLAITRFHAGLVVDTTTADPELEPVLPDDDAERVHLARLVWRATADLPLRERALLELNLRQGLDGTDLADALGVGPAEGADLQARMPDLEKGLAGYLIMRRADWHCGDLGLVLRGWDGLFTPVVANGIAAHLSACRVCEKSRSALPSPFSLYAWALPAPPPGHDLIRPRDVDEARR